MSAMGHCPRCRLELSPPAGGLGERLCNRCAGRFLEPAGVTRLVVDEHGLDPAFLRELTSQFAGERAACPGCRSGMSPVQLRGGYVDLCEGCGGLWLDAGDLSRLGEGRWEEVMPSEEEHEEAERAFAKLPPPPKKKRRRRGGRIDLSDFEPTRWLAYSLTLIACTVLVMAVLPRSRTLTCAEYRYAWGYYCTERVEHFVGPAIERPLSVGPEPAIYEVPSPDRPGRWTVAVDGEVLRGELWFSGSKYEAIIAVEQYRDRVELMGWRGSTLHTRTPWYVLLLPLPLYVGFVGVLIAGLMWLGRLIAWMRRR
jgi:Zn-finger nucleic acid-binding protein